MEIREGYKLTELGLVPTDWKVVKLDDIGRFSKGQGIRKNDSNSGDIPCIRYGELYTKHNDIIKSYYSYISLEISETSKRLKPGDILFAGSGETKEEIGKCAAFVDDINAFAGGDIVILSPKSTDSKFLGYLLNSPKVASQKATRGQGDAVVHISAGQLGNIKVAIPVSIQEQTAIASAVSDIDTLLTSLKKLIAKKRDIKQGVMQLLLQPKEGWQLKKLGEIGTVIRGASPRPQGDKRYYGGSVPRLMVEDVTRDGKFVTPKVDYLTVEGAKRSRPCKAGTLTIVCSGTVGIPSILAVGECKMNCVRS